VRGSALISPLQLGPLEVAVPLALAPLAGVGNAPFRLVCREMGAGLAWSEMICARALARDHRGTLEVAELAPGEGPVVMQLFGRDPGEMAEGAMRLASLGAAAVDINMGCPVKKILKSGAGVQLMREPHLAEAIVFAACKAVAVPLTVKIRLGWDESDACYLEFARRMVGAGAAAVTLHPRTRVQGFTGRARWEHVARLKEALAAPVLGSGDVKTPADAVEAARLSGCDGILVGRGALGRPWVFGEMAQALGFLPPDAPLPGAIGPERLDAILRHVRLIRRLCPGRRALPHLRKHLAWYSRGMAEGSAFRHLIGGLPTPEAIVGAAAPFFGFAWEEQGAAS
jgi:tRNA-dihydrouridine synthase B